MSWFDFVVLLSKFKYQYFSETFELSNTNLVSKKSHKNVISEKNNSPETIGEANGFIKVPLEERAWEQTNKV